MPHTVKHKKKIYIQTAHSPPRFSNVKQNCVNLELLVHVILNIVLVVTIDMYIYSFKI